MLVEDVIFGRFEEKSAAEVGRTGTYLTKSVNKNTNSPFTAVTITFIGYRCYTLTVIQLI